VPLRWITSTAAISGHHPEQHLYREGGVGVQHLDHVGDDQRADERAAQHDAAGGARPCEVDLPHQLFGHRRQAQHAEPADGVHQQMRAALELAVDGEHPLVPPFFVIPTETSGGSYAESVAARRY
jgi:hypothetical protein